MKFIEPEECDIVDMKILSQLATSGVVQILSCFVVKFQFFITQDMYM